MMDEIERQIQLPPEAKEFERYARYYTFDDGRVIGTYVASGGGDPLIGKRLWVSDKRYLPTLMDGGCVIVNVVYDPIGQKIEHTFCNGLA